MFDDENYVDPEVDGMDPGGSVEAPPKRTRAPRTPKAKAEPKEGGSTGFGLHLLVDDGKIVEHGSDREAVRVLAAKVVINPKLALYKAETVTPDSIFQQ